jgi:dipeptidyl aminopeptidase/acylaminoacyl peptidase
MVAAIRRHGGKVEYIVYEDEAHGFRKRKNAIHAYEAIVKFLDSNLKSKMLQSLDVHSMGATAVG